MPVNSEREYVGLIWIGDGSGIRLSVLASSIEEAQAQVVAQYGEGHVMTLHNEEDARGPR